MANIKFNSIEHIDDFENTLVIWVDILVNNQ